MTSKDALAGFQRMQNHFGQKRYKEADLNPVWLDLLSCSVEAFEKAIGVLIMHGKFLPSPDYVLEQTRQWERRLRAESRLAPESRVEGLGSESIRLTRGYLDGTLRLRDYIAGLYLLSERTGNVEYAQEARRKEKILNEQERS